MTEDQKAREARAKAYAASLFPPGAMRFTVEEIYLKGAEEERAAMDAKLNHEVYLSDKRAQERDRAEAKYDALAEKERTLRSFITTILERDLIRLAIELHVGHEMLSRLMKTLHKANDDEERSSKS